MTDRRRPWLTDIVAGLAVYVFTSLPVLMGVSMATTLGVMRHSSAPPCFVDATCQFDGAHFASIIDDGYRYDRDNASTVAFFPGYPVVGGWVRSLGNWPARLATVVTANVSFALALILLSAYLRVRYPEDAGSTRLTILILIGLWPAGFFFRMGYSESLFLLTLALLLLGFTRRWPVWLLAFIAGAATGIRLVGIVASAAVVYHVVSDEERGSSRRRLLLAAALAPLTCWGILAFIGYQEVRFHTPVAFVDAQKHWAFYSPLPGEISSKAVRLAVAEPIWNMYVPGSSRHWMLFHATKNPLFGIMFWNPILFTLASVAVIIGLFRGWLTRPEAVIGVGLLLIPYVTRGDELCMGSQARFTTVVVPAFVVMGRLLGRSLAAITTLLLAVAAALLMLWSALFAAGWPMC